MTPERRQEIEEQAKAYRRWTGVDWDDHPLIRELLTEIDRLKQLECPDLLAHPGGWERVAVLEDEVRHPHERPDREPHEQEG